jgi:large subunit ribosomal protein L23
MRTLSAYAAIVRPVVSEKSTVLGEQGKYVFEVAPDANKIQIKHAIEEVFANKKVQVSTVNILRVPGKLRRRGRSVGMTRSWKKAIVTLRAGQRLDLFEGV